MTTNKGDNAKKATNKRADQNDDQPEDLDIQQQADRVLSGEATTVNTRGAAPGTTPMRDMDPAVRSGPVNAPTGEADSDDNSKTSK